MSGYGGGCEGCIRHTHCNGIAYCLSQPGDAPPCPYDTAACGDYRFEACEPCLDDVEGAMWRDGIYISHLDLSMTSPNRPPHLGASRRSTQAGIPTRAIHDRNDPEKATALDQPFPPESVGRLPKGGVQLDHVDQMRLGVALDLWAEEELVEFAQAASCHRVARVVPDTSDGYDDDAALLSTGCKLADGMYAAINDANVQDRTAYISDVIGRDITSTKEMTEGEARSDLDDWAVAA
jgi:hypothetical protein